MIGNYPRCGQCERQRSPSHARCAGLVKITQSFATMADNETHARDVTNVNRRVANLSSSQIENKRAIDRANQRFFRAKRKSEVDQLQKEVERLASELQETRRELSGYQERERILRDAFSNAFGLSTSVDPFSTGFDAIFAPNSRSRSTNFDAGLSNEAASASEGTGPSSMGSELNTYQQPFPIDFGTGINMELSNSNHVLDYSMMRLEGDIFLPTQPSTGTSPTSASSSSYAQSQSRAEATAALEDVPDWQGLPINIAPSTQLDHVILDTTNAFRDTSQSGSHHDEMSASRFPSISSLLNRQAKEVKKLYPVSNAAAAQVWRSPIEAFPSRVGFMYMLSHLLRWYICRTQESFEKLPECLRPTLLQRTVPHPAWIDVIVWSENDERLLRKEYANLLQAWSPRCNNPAHGLVTV